MRYFCVCSWSDEKNVKIVKAMVMVKTYFRDGSWMSFYSYLCVTVHKPSHRDIKERLDQTPDAVKYK